MRRAGLTTAVALALASGCGGEDGGGAPTPPDEPPAATGAETEPPPPAVPMTAMPAQAGRICGRFPVLAPSCPGRVPESQFGLAGPPVGFPGPYADGGCVVCLMREVGACGAAVFHLEGGVPTDDPRRDRPPAFLHLALYAAKGELDRHFPFELPCTGPVVRENADRLLGAPTETAACLGNAELGGRTGTLSLAPPFPGGGEAGGHLLFLWEEDGVSYAATLHAWRPVEEAIDTLGRVTASAP
jgi:hypothetical protein